jgi:ABC-type Zn uptake system ZnuABC Zn-binding protein ZnuA
MKCLLHLMLALAFCARAGAADALRVSSFSTILTEIATEVGGERVKVHAHVKPGVDPHEFQPKPDDLRIVAGAQIVLLSAKHMEGYVGKLKEATGSSAVFVDVGDAMPSLTLTVEHGDHSHDGEDPHWWHSIANMRRATKVIRAAFTANATRYLAGLDALETWAKSKVAELSRNSRKLVTSHDAFQYFARDYGFTIYAIEGLSTADQPSSGKVAAIIAAIRAQGVKAVFPESIENPKVLSEITRESGAKVGPALYADGLGEGNARTYAGMFRHNVTAIVDALK